MSLAGNVYWQDDIALYVDNAVDATGAECEGSTQDSYTIYNASFDWEGLLGIPQLSLKAWGKNLSDKEYYVSALCLYNTVGISVNYQGEPRMYGLDISYEF
jgi:outer membrane receptor protein involved in Fe transport